MHLNREREYARLSRAVEVEQEVASVSHYSSVFGPLYQLILVADLTGVIISVSQYLYVQLYSHTTPAFYGLDVRVLLS